MKEFHPPKRILMGPGPSDVDERILRAMAQPTIGHLDPEFIRMMDELKEFLRLAFRTKNDFTLPLSAPGSAGMEACFVNLVEPGEKVVICQNGVFGGRMAEIVRRCGGQVVLIEQEWGRAIDVAALETELKAHPDAKFVGMVHAETSTGVLSDIEALCKVSHQYGCLTIVDAVTSLGGNPLLIDDWQVDAVYAGSQKCLSCPPGLSPISLGAAAIEKVKSRKTPPVSWFLDFNLLLGYWGEGAKRSYHHTAPVNALYGLHQALYLLLEEGLVQSWQRHAKLHEKLKLGFEKLGLDLLVPEKERLWQLNAVRIPDGVDDLNFRSRLLSEFDLEIGAGLGPLAGKIWRVGLMGHACSDANVDYCLNAFKACLEN